MLICHCTLPSTNPDACKTCSEYLRYYGNYTPVDPFYPSVPTSPDVPWDPSPYPNTISASTKYYPQRKQIRKIKRTTERYDVNGLLIGKEVITEEEEITNPPYDIVYEGNDNESSPSSDINKD